MDVLQKLEFQGSTILDAGIQKQLDFALTQFKSISTGSNATSYRILLLGTDTSIANTVKYIATISRQEIYRIDLSTIVSKYIGETEKNLNKVFEKAANKNWILYFDEADALFGKRTGVRDSHDRFANQEVSYLLTKMESHNGITILASNLKGNIDKAFTRRFQAIINGVEV